MMFEWFFFVRWKSFFLFFLLVRPFDVQSEHVVVTVTTDGRFACWNTVTNLDFLFRRNGKMGITANGLKKKYLLTFNKSINFELAKKQKKNITNSFTCVQFIFICRLFSINRKFRIFLFFYNLSLIINLFPAFSTCLGIDGVSLWYSKKIKLKTFQFFFIFFFWRTYSL